VTTAPPRARLGPVLCVFVAVGFLATCAAPFYRDHKDYTQRFPLDTKPETVSVPARFSGAADPFAGAEREKFDTLVEGYLDHGHGPLTIAARAPASSSSPTLARMATLRDRLVAAGVPASEIRMQLASEGAANTVTLSYERYNAVVPSCGDWSAPMAPNSGNADYPAFGCAQQHNLGVMVADPADLVSMHRAEPTDTANVERVMRDYRGVGLGPSAAPVATEANKNALQNSADLNAASGSTVGQGATSTR
jgi:pilus assembly protein CpaD